MGCVSSSPENSQQAGTKGEDVEGDVQQIEAAKRQRRRLSMTPVLVGDISTKSAFRDRKASIKAGVDELSQMELNAKGNLMCVMNTKTGYIPYNTKKQNQDRAVVKFGLKDDVEIQMFGVCDGHGEFGHLVSDFVQTHLPPALAKQKYLKTDTEKAIFAGVAEVVEALDNKEPTNENVINTSFSGTTCVFTVKVQRELYCANIGDSRCIVVSYDPKTDKTKAIALSEDQNPDNPGEEERIYECGGRVAPLPGLPGTDRGPARVWLLDVDVPGLAMSRSIGDDVGRSVGVLSIPEIMHHTVTENDICSITASDGVWEFISNDEACALVSHWLPHGLQKACDELCQEAKKRWKAEEEVIDDITCVLLGFDTEAAKKHIKLV